MRYRPFNSQGLSSSAITLSVPSGMSPKDADGLVCAALECGVNSFCLAPADASAAAALRGAVAAVGRRVLILVLRLDPEGGGFERQAGEALQASGASYFDLALVDPGAASLSAERLAQLAALRARRTVSMLGVMADGATAPTLLNAMDFDVLAVRYNIASGWAERNLLKTAAARGMTVLGYDHHVGPSGPRVAPVVRGLSRMFGARATPVQEAYGFLEHCPGWTPQQITLGYALTEPGLASILVEVDDPAVLEGLAEAMERELPAGVAAQIEIARFALVGRQGAA